jgi:nitrogen regulatory protein PII 2
VKQIIAIIRPQMANKTRDALVNAGLAAFTARKVLGRGRGNVDFRVLRAAENGTEEAIARLGDGPMLVSKRMMTIVVPDDRAASVVQTIIDTNKTGKPGDGKIFVVPVQEVVRIRTGERDSLALSQS